jgi:hypothetical protein
LRAERHSLIVPLVPQRLPRHQRFEERERRVQHQAAQLLGDDRHLLLRFFRELQRLEDDQKLVKILLEGGDEAPDARTVTTAQHHDPEHLRGLPAIGHGVSGAVRGSDPVRALLAKEARQRR